MWQAQWVDHTDRKMDQSGKALEELDALLDSIHQSHREHRAILVEIERTEGGGFLSIGLGRNISILSHVPGNLDPPYSLSVGHASKARVVRFDYMGQESEFDGRHALPVAVAREVLREFVSSGRLSDKIPWEEV